MRDLRDQMPRLLWDRGQDGDRDALHRLSETHDKIHELFRRWTAHDEARSLLSPISEPDIQHINKDGQVPLDKLVRCLTDPTYRVIRSSDDLQTVVCEALAEIGKTAKLHLAMLYTPRRKPPQDRLQEDALQAYIQCRLSDRLPGRALDERATVIFIDRETLASHDQRLDIKVQAPALDGDVATVVIEIKWSDHVDILKSIASQLGGRYLVEQNLTHGIYLIGFCGEWGSWPADMGQPPSNDDTGTWRAAIKKIGDTFAKENDVQIETIMIDLRWDNIKKSG